LEPSGRDFQVTEDDVILDKALELGIRMPHGCRAGTCKSCKAKVIAGSVDVGRAFPAPMFLRRMRQFDGYTLMCRATAASDLVIEVDEQPHLPAPRTGTAVVSKIEIVGTDVAILRLQVGAADAVSFVAGQYIDLLLADGVRRSYSIAVAPRQTGVEELEFHIRHMPGGVFSDKVFGDLTAGDTLAFEAPLGSFYLRESEKPALLLASGTGYAPIRSILLDTLPQNRGRQLTLYWGARKAEDIYLIDEAREFAEKYPEFDFIPVLSEPNGAPWDGRTGLVHEAVMDDIADLSEWQVYACGAPLMVEAARRDFVARHKLPGDEFFADSFLSQADLANESPG
jgi:CDP-4-dehydro-6-deoxyglucose reductase